jgi:predicted NBD/HSP70 family sugar kinase
MKKVSTVAVKATKNVSQPKLTIGLDLGDRSSWYCLLDEVGEVLLEQKLSTTPKANPSWWQATTQAILG